MLSDLDLYLLREGTHARLYDILGAHPIHQPDGSAGGVRFAVWAPNAERVTVIGDWNGWDPHADPLQADPSGIWHGVVHGAQAGQLYKYHLCSRHHHQELVKADPVAFSAEVPPATGSRIWALQHTWGDAEWMASRGKRQALDAPISIYEVHAGSWRRPEGQPMGYRQLAHELASYVKDLGFTHVELMPITEHPFYGSWGYQVTGYFAPTSRYGTPEDFMYFVDHLHQQGIGVILDWVPSHFPTDAHGLHYFDGTHLYEHADPRQGFHPEWHSSIFNYGRGEVSSFLISSALFWLDKYHIDGLRVDAVASMLYLDYARKQGEWVPNRHGGKENLEAITFLRRLNQAIYQAHPDTLPIAEESTAWPMVSRPTDMGGLGFGMKWNMGWMHDTLSFMHEDPVYRKHHLGRLTFSLVYAFNENFVLPLSHDEVVYGKGSLINKMPGDPWQKFANLRLLLALMWTHPGKKLLFMGGEFGQWREWTHEGQLEWPLLEHPAHQGLWQMVRQLNAMYRAEPALYQIDFSPEGFEWIEGGDAQCSVIAFLRKARSGPLMLVVCNLTPVPRQGYRLGVPCPGHWQEVFNSDACEYGGSGWGNLGGVDSQPASHHGRPFTLALTLPPLSTIVLRWSGHGAHAA
ncbi:MAG: 1,4-alpha-glucan branching protein GlgB [Aquabacterium sp.]